MWAYFQGCTLGGPPPRLADSALRPLPAPNFQCQENSEIFKVASPTTLCSPHHAEYNHQQNTHYTFIWCAVLNCQPQTDRVRVRGSQDMNLKLYLKFLCCTSLAIVKYRVFFPHIIGTWNDHDHPTPQNPFLFPQKNNSVNVSMIVIIKNI